MSRRSRVLARGIGCALAGFTLVISSGCASVSPEDAAELPGDSWADKFASCMSERGWEASVESDGGVVTEWADAQEEIYKIDSAECATAAGSGTELSPAEYEAGYEALIVNWECIVGAGYDLPDPPTYQAWRDIGAAWNPYADLPSSLSSEDLVALTAKCPPAGA